jgi:hypothetical protein
MKNRQTEVNKVYIPYVEKYLGSKLIQNVLVTGGSFGAVKAEIKRHKNLNYENIFHFESVKSEINYNKVKEPDGNRFKNYKQVFKRDIFSPDTYVQSVNLIYADVSPDGSQPKKDEIIKILYNGFIDNELGILVFLFFDGIAIGPFLDKQYGEYKSKDFFSKIIEWDDGFGVGKQRLDGVVFNV